MKTSTQVNLNWQEQQRNRSAFCVSHDLTDSRSNQMELEHDPMKSKRSETQWHQSETKIKSSEFSTDATVVLTASVFSHQLSE